MYGLLLLPSPSTILTVDFRNTTGHTTLGDIKLALKWFNFPSIIINTLAGEADQEVIVHFQYELFNQLEV